MTSEGETVASGAEQRLLDQLVTIAHNAEVARKAWLSGDFNTVALATTALQVGAENLDTDLSEAHEERRGGS